MSVETQDVEVEVDLSKLIDVGLSFLPLQLTMKDILQRLARLERENTAQNHEIGRLTANMAELEAANESLQKAQQELADAAAAAAPVDPEGPPRMSSKDLEAEHAAIWEEMSRLNSLLGDLQEDAERDRHTIDEIYAARKQLNSAAAATGGVSRHPSVSTASKSGASPSVQLPAAIAGAVSPARGTSANSAVAGTSQRQHDAAVSAEASMPVGDLILSKAHQALELAPEADFTAFHDSRDGSQRGDADEESGASRASGGAAPASLSSRPMSGGGGGAPPPPRRGMSIVDGPHGPQSRASIIAPLPRGQETHPASASPKATSGSSLTWAATTGGEDAGEHREAAAAEAAPASVQQQQLRRPSMYAEKRMSTSAARRASNRAATAATDAGSPATPPSVFDKLRRDGEDIAYLNRVVAEILGEMKGLHEDVDFLRTTHREADSAGDRSGAVMDGDELDNLLRRVARVEADVVDTRQQTQHRDDRLQEDLDDLKKQLRVARGLTDDDVDALRRAAELAERLRQAEERLRALEAGQGMLQQQFADVLAVGAGDGGDGASEVNALQFAALQGTVKELERQLAALLAAQEGQRDWTEDIRKLNDAVRAVEGAVETAQDQLQRLQREAARLEEAKANRTELPEEVPRRSSAGGDAAVVADVAARLSRAEANIERLSDGKADRTALHKLRDELNALRQLVELANAQRRDGGGDDDGKLGAASEGLLRDLQGELSALKEAYNARVAGGSMSGEDADDLRGRIDRLDHCKADATLVANKAERDYVENALERLMREVEQVLNATNAGLIDTLEKSLGILRDMIDGRASKQDVANLQGWMAEANVGGGGGAGAPDGLTGFKGFRCLGCNRPMDNMRPRTLPATMTPFLNRNPQNHPQDTVTRTIQQQQAPPRAASGPTAVAGVTGAAHRPTAGTPDGSFHRSTNSEPLPPIEPM
ncbi:hypothetical protein NESM_000228400 [Novymonas esmeraldas]|uniref:Uncharacterized protein n=1 Tax=Novymonas esmeraldas TaxID=1808958 RepID=A0AAW0F7F0_9TRYP